MLTIARRGRRARTTGLAGPRGTRPLPGAGWAPSGRARSATTWWGRVLATPVARARRRRARVATVLKADSRWDQQEIPLSPLFSFHLTGGPSVTSALSFPVLPRDSAAMAGRCRSYG